MNKDESVMEIESLNLDDLKVEEIDGRIELAAAAASSSYGGCDDCSSNGCSCDGYYG